MYLSVIRDGEVCLPEDDYGKGLDFDDEFVFENPHDEDYDYENDYDYFDDFEFDEDDEDIYYTILYLVDSSMVTDPYCTYSYYLVIISIVLIFCQYSYSSNLMGKDVHHINSARSTMVQCTYARTKQV